MHDNLDIKFVNFLTYYLYNHRLYDVILLFLKTHKFHI